MAEQSNAGYKEKWNLFSLLYRGLETVPPKEVEEKKEPELKSSPIPEYASYVVLSPKGGSLAHDTNIEITFNQTAAPIPTQWILEKDGLGFTLGTPGLYFFQWGINNTGASSNYFIAHLVNKAQFITEQWHTSDFPLLGVQDSHLFSYVHRKKDSTLDSHAFLIRASTNQRTDPIIGLMGLTIVFFPF